MRLHLEMSEEELHLQGSKEAETVAHVFIKAFDLYQRKRITYGKAWREQGYMGQTARILSKASRLKNMVWREQPFDNTEETVDDTVIDIINLCVFWLLNRGQQNKWGRGADGLE